MTHTILTCKNHTDLRWSCKDIAITDGKYNGTRSLFFKGTPTGEGMYSDGSGLNCSEIKDGKIVEECNCNTDCLIIAPENKLVKRGD